MYDFPPDFFRLDLIDPDKFGHNPKNWDSAKMTTFDATLRNNSKGKLMGLPRGREKEAVEIFFHSVERTLGHHIPKAWRITGAVPYANYPDLVHIYLKVSIIPRQFMSIYAKFTPWGKRMKVRVGAPLPLFEERDHVQA